jgi:hypothetical protein
MPKYGIRIVIVLSVMLLLPVFSPARAEIRPLDQTRDIESLSRQSQDKYLPAVAQIKKLVDTGQCKEAVRAFNQLKSDFPEITKPDSDDLELFIEAEMLRCKGKFIEAARCYGRLMDKFLPESRFYEAALDRQFRIAEAFLAGRERPILGIFKIKGYSEGVRIMEGITYRLGFDDPVGIKAALAVAQGYQERKKFDEAYYRWAEIREQCNNEKLRKEALLAMAQCRLAMYKGYQYDTSALIGRPLNPQSYYDSTKGCYEEFKLRHPDDATEFEIERRLKEIDEKLAFKQFKIGQYYQETGNKLSANLYYKMVMNRWPETEAAKMAEEMLIKDTGAEEKEK